MACTQNNNTPVWCRRSARLYGVKSIVNNINCFQCSAFLPPPSALHHGIFWHLSRWQHSYVLHMDCLHVVFCFACSCGSFSLSLSLISFQTYTHIIQCVYKKELHTHWYSSCTNITLCTLVEGEMGGWNQWEKLGVQSLHTGQITGGNGKGIQQVYTLTHTHTHTHGKQVGQLGSQGLC